MVLGFGTFGSPIILAVLAGVGATEGILSEVLVLGVVKKNTAKYKKKVEHIQEYLSKSWFLFEKIREESVITLQELEEFRQLMENFQKDLSIEDNNNVFIKLRESLKKRSRKRS